MSLILIVLLLLPLGLYGQTETTCNFMYVSVSGSGNGLTPSNPTTLPNALLTTNPNFLGSILIMMASGTYNFTTTINIPSNVILDGGYLPNSTLWTKSLSAATIIYIYPPSTTSVVSGNTVYSHIGFSAINSTNFILKDIQVKVKPTAATSASIYALYLYNVSSFQIIRSSFESGNAGSGTNGSSGAAGLDGGAGSDATSNFYGANGGTGANGTPQSGSPIICGNSGAIVFLVPSFGIGANGGSGGAGRCAAGSITGGGANGGASSGGFSGGAGGAAINSNVPGNDGQNGTKATSINGTNYVANNRPTGLFDKLFIPVTGIAGGYGAGGAGGGGGSGGWSSSGTGAGGGGGGGGGAGGIGGSAGTGGGSSFAIYANLYSNYSFVQVQLITGTFGTGGTGGAGGSGGKGGKGGSYGLSGIIRSGAGGNGGDGASGGRGQDGSNGVSMASYPSNLLSSTTIPLSSLYIQSMPSCTNSQVTISGTSGITPMSDSAYVNDIGPLRTSYSSSSTSVNMVWDTVGIKNVNVSGNVYIGAVMIAQVRGLPSIGIANSTVCVGTPISVTTNSNNAVFDWRLYNTVPTSPILTFNTQNFTFITDGFTGTFNISLSTYSPCCAWSIPVFSSVTINPLPTISFSLSSSYCNNDLTNYALQPNPSGGVFQGSGIVYGNYFSPSSVVPGNYTLIYSYTNPVTLCSNNVTMATTIYDVPSITFLDLQDSYCKYPQQIILAGTPSGGVFSGMGVVGNLWNLSNVNTSSVNITYSYTFPTGCINTIVKTVTLYQIPSTPIISNLVSEYCSNDDSVILQASPVGGVFISDVVFANGTLVPKNIVPGTYNVTYIVTNIFNCSSSITRYFTVKYVPSVNFTGLDNQYCRDASAIDLVPDSNDNYTFTGPGMNGTTFTPSEANVGVNTIVYTVYFNNSCSNQVTQSVTVNSLPLLYFNNLFNKYCLDDKAILLSMTPSGGTVTGPGINSTHFDPLKAGLGTHTVTYSYTSPTTGCFNSTSTTVTVIPACNATFPATTLIFQPNETFELFQLEGVSKPWSSQFYITSLPIGKLYQYTVKRTQGSIIQEGDRILSSQGYLYYEAANLKTDGFMYMTVSEIGNYTTSVVLDLQYLPILLSTSTTSTSTSTSSSSTTGEVNNGTSTSGESTPIVVDKSGKFIFNDSLYFWIGIGVAGLAVIVIVVIIVAVVLAVKKRRARDLEIIEMTTPPPPPTTMESPPPSVSSDPSPPSTFEKPPTYKSDYIQVDRLRAETNSIPNSSIKHYVKMQQQHHHQSTSISPIISDIELSTCEISENDLAIEPNAIGIGAHGKVYKGMWRGTQVAVKMVETSMSDKQLLEFKSEAIIHKKLRSHTNVVSFFGVCVTTKRCMIVTEYMPGGSLLNLIQSTEIDRERALRYMQNIAAGMLHLHSEGIIHRDLAARNCLIGNMIVKVADMGMSRFLPGSKDTHNSRPSQMPLKWLAPECVTRNEYSRESDVWSFGIVIYEVMWRKVPYEGIDPLQIAVAMESEKTIPHLPKHPEHPELSDVMKLCLSYAPHDRPSFKDICDFLNSLTNK